MQLALFDLDHTLLNCDSDYEWTRFLVDKGVLDAQFQVQNELFYTQYKVGTLDIDEFLDFQFQAFARNSRLDLECWQTEFMHTRIRPMILTQARELVQSHQQNGDLCAIITATNSFVTGPIGRELGVSHLIATVAAQENGQFTGKARGIPAFRAGKIARLDSWLESLGLWLGHFERSWFYSDSHNDLPLLQRVSNPVATNPDPELRAHAQAAGWPILELSSQ